jgi:hypothetical protein
VRAAEKPSPGLCAAWSGVAVDLSAVATNGGAVAPGTVHGNADGMSMLTQSGIALDVVRIAKDGTANVVELPQEKDAQAVNALATPDGGWLVAWVAGGDLAQLYFVRYDAGGNPVARTGGQQQYASAVVVGLEPGGDVDVAWSDGSTALMSVLPAGAPRSFPTGTPFGVDGDGPEIFAGGRLFGQPHDSPDRFVAWDRTGARVLDMPVAFGPAAELTPGADGASALRALSDSVVFEDATVATVVPVDVALEGGIVGTRAGAVVGTLESAEADGGGTLAAVLFEVTKAGARSPLATVSLDASPYTLGSNGDSVVLAGADGGDTFFVVFSSVVSYQPPLAAAFTCTRRS